MVLLLLVQPVAGLVRYMTRAHRRDFIESLLCLISKTKQAGMVQLLRQRYKTAVVLRDTTFPAAVAAAKAEADKAGVKDHAAAVTMFLQHSGAPGVAVPDTAAGADEEQQLKVG